MLFYRHAQLSDLEKIVSIYNSTVPTRMSTADTIPVSVESKLQWFHAHNLSTRPLWVAETDAQQTAGWISLSSFSERPAYNGAAEISIYIDEAFRGKGLGKEMLQYAIEKAPLCDIKNLLAKIFAHNTTSIHLFQKFGFEHWGLLPEVAVLDGKPASVVILGKKLSDNFD